MAIRMGTPGNDLLTGTASADYMSGGVGDDWIDGLAGNDYLYGGDGDDSLSDGTGVDRLFGQVGSDEFIMDLSGGADVVDGGWDVDYVIYNHSTGTVRVDFLNNAVNAGAAAGDQFISVEGYQGGLGVDLVFGSDERNWFIASLGNDKYFGRGGVDVYRAWQTGSDVERLEIAFGARAATLASAAGIAAPPAGAAVAFYDIWNDTNLNSTRDPGEVTRYADILDSIEVFIGTTGADRMVGSAADEGFAPNGGADQINGGAGIDTLTYETLAAASTNPNEAVVTVDLAAGTAIQSIFNFTTFIYDTITTSVAAIEDVLGSRYDDQIAGNSLANEIAGGDGSDALDGRGGRDYLYGGNGDDLLVGGDDTDVLSGGEGADLIDGGAGIDTADYSHAATSIAVSLLTGQGLVPIINQVQILNAESIGDALLNVERVVGSLHDDVISGDDGANLLEGRTGNDLLIGCGGVDIIYGEKYSASNVPDYRQEPDYTDGSILDDCGCDDDDEPTDSEAAKNYSDTIDGGDGSDYLYGQLGDDDICGGTGNDQLFGNEGADILDGEGDNDRLEGGLGTDFLYGGSGNDAISGGAGFDIIFGGSGTDTVDYSGSTAAVTVNLQEFWTNSGGDAATDLISDMMTTLADGGDPSAVLSSALFLSLMQTLGATGTETGFTLSVPDVIVGVEGIVGSNYSDKLTGDAAANTLNGGNGNDVIEGGSGNDTIIGGAGADVLNGMNGDDRITGGAGNDTLTGGVGQDRFTFDTAPSASTNRDVITDFTAADDTIVLVQSVFSGLATGTLSASAFQLGTAANDAGDRIIYDKPTGRIFYDADGNGSGAAINFATLALNTALTNVDFFTVATAPAASSSASAARLSAAMEPHTSAVPAIAEHFERELFSHSTAMDWHAFDSLV